MRNALIILGICIAAIVVGVLLYMYGPEDLNQASVLEDSSAAALRAESLEEIGFAEIAAGANAAEVTKRKNIAVYTREEFARLWEMAYGSDASPLPEIDFTKEYVIGVFAGLRPSGGHGISVVQISDSSTTRMIRVEQTTPGEGCMTTQAFTSPFQLVRVPITTLQHASEEKEQVVPCS